MKPSSAAPALSLLGLISIPSVAPGQSLLPYSQDFETVPSPNVPNVALFADAVPGQWYNRYGDSGTALDGHESESFSVGVYTTSQGGNKWPATDPNRSSVLRVGYANDSVKSLVTLELDDKWDSNETYKLSFQWAIADHGNTGRDFKLKIFGCPTYNLGYPGAPEQFRSKPTDLIAGGAQIKEVQLDQGLGVSLLDTVYTEEIMITGAEIDAAGQNGNQIYFGFEKPDGTEFYMVDNLSFELVIAVDTDSDDLPDSVETGGEQATGTLGPYFGPDDTGTFLDLADSDGDGIDDGDEVNGESVSGNSYTSDPTVMDTDFDTLDDGDEINGTLNVLYGNAPTNPDDLDTDDDGIDDDVEINTTGTNPAVADTDGDGLDDGEEDVNQDGTVDPTETSATLTDTDNDGLDDKWELDNGFDPTGTDDSMGDPDGDLLVNDDEFNNGVDSSDPNDPDTDNDGLNDKFEWESTGLGGSFLNLLSRDTDNDGLGDKFEVDNGLDPFVDDDFDLDSFSDTDEVLFFGTNPKDITDFPGDADSPAPGGLTPILDGGSVGASDTFGLAGTLGSAVINEAAQGGTNIDYSTGVTDFTVLYDNAFASAGSEVTLTGFAWPVTAGGNVNGEIRVEFYDPGADGVFDGVDTDTFLGSATGSLTVPASTGVMYWNFDSPIAFTSTGTGLAVRILGTEAMRLKAKLNADNTTGFRHSNQGDGPIAALNSLRFSLGGSVISPTINLSLTDYNGGSPILDWTTQAISGGIDLYRSTDMETWTGPISTDDLDGTHTDATAPAGRAFYLALPNGSPPPGSP